MKGNGMKPIEELEELEAQDDVIWTFVPDDEYVEGGPRFKAVYIGLPDDPVPERIQTI
jgi:hypothetical protein